MPQENRYPTDLTDAQWKVIKPLVPDHGTMGRPLKHERRRIVDAILYITQAGCAWRMLPHDFPPWLTVYDYFRQWQRKGYWRHIHDRLRESVRRAAKKNFSHRRHPRQPERQDR
jgi:putative transposase